MNDLSKTTLAGCGNPKLESGSPKSQDRTAAANENQENSKNANEPSWKFISETPAAGMNGGSSDSNRQILCHPISRVPEILLIWTNKFPQALDVLLAPIPTSHKKLFHKQGSYLQLLNSHNILSEVAFLTLPSPILDELCLSLLYRLVTNLVKIP